MSSGNKTFNCIVENRFHNVDLVDKNAVYATSHFGEVISRCKYLVCVPRGFYGLESTWDESGEGWVFTGFVLHDIGGMVPNLMAGLNFKSCSFHVLGDGDESTMFLVAVEMNGDKEEKYHYFQLSESSLDEAYGFVEMDSVVVDQLIVPPSDVFSQVDSIRSLDTVSIAMTNHGFWDLEYNQTNDVVCSYRGAKQYVDSAGLFNDDDTKLVTPTMQILDTKYCEYCDEVRGVDRLWK